MCDRNIDTIAAHYSQVGDLLEDAGDHAAAIVHATIYLALRDLQGEHLRATSELHAQIAGLRRQVRDLQDAATGSAAGLIASSVISVATTANGSSNSPITQAPAPLPAITSTDAPLVEAQPAERTPATLQWPTLDDTSLSIVRGLDDGSRTWRTVDTDDRKVLVLAAIKEMCDLSSPEQLGILRYDEWRPVWMPKFTTLTAQLSMTWVQMRAAAQGAF